MSDAEDVKNVVERPSRRDLVMTGVAAALGAVAGSVVVPSPAVAGHTPGHTPLAPNIKKLGCDISDQVFQIHNVKCFGAVGDGVANDTAAIQKAINLLPPATPGDISNTTNGGVVFFPPGIYRIESSLEIIADAAHNYRYGIQLVGSGGGASGFSSCVLKWAGPPTDPMLVLHSRDCIVSHLAFRVASGHSTVAAIDIDASGPGGLATTNNVFEHVGINPDQGSMTYGVRIGANALGNVEVMKFNKCYFSHLDDSCVFIPSTTAQSKSHSFYDCSFSFAPYGIRTVSGSFQTYSCYFGVLGVAIKLGASTDNILIQDSDEESCPRFLESQTNPVSWPVFILGGRFSLDQLHDDGRFIIFGDGGPLVIQNCNFESDQKPGSNPFKISAGTFKTNNAGTVLVSIGNSFPNPTPYDVEAGLLQRRVSLGNRAGFAEPVLVDDEITSVNGATGAVRLSTVRSISATAKHAQNLRGSITIDTGPVVVDVVFDVPEPDAGYFVSAVVAGVTGTPPAESTRIYISEKTAAGFNVHLGVAPGVGNSVTVDWILIR